MNGPDGLLARPVVGRPLFGKGKPPLLRRVALVGDGRVPVGPAALEGDRRRPGGGGLPALADGEGGGQGQVGDAGDGVDGDGGPLDGKGGAPGGDGGARLLHIALGVDGAPVGEGDAVDDAHVGILALHCRHPVAAVPAAAHQLANGAVLQGDRGVAR